MILLISDLHLQEERPDLTRAFLRFLNEKAAHATALYILGDFFEAWIGDDGMTPYQEGIARALKQLSDRGTRIYFMHGNRDFLIGKAFCRIAGCELLPDPSRVVLNGTPVVLMHGDSLCTRDIGYMRLRRWLRNPIVLWILTHLPLQTRRKLARKLRSESKEQTKMKSSAIVDVTPEEIPPLLDRLNASILIHGHTHRPAIHELTLAGGRSAKRIVLGDWERQGWALECDENGELALEAFDIEPVG
ncbi:UDP-2,3-diacylglucosamine diphosphatase [Pseudomonas matsuisoli]|uniref:UDP-2,3-diacylglucosamine hydrolase n=1 Tax=Pseudomonas matsuisoli TaxID=1515666 RepID=A0A917V0X6_9PSED|nr:UDP-2,3-diacylglucosamine diphosphatase [Pseudomonas matsuisoli]GGK05899.1 UDP-2,3-diacylglucosamine hydrolase [Pseudomonas matsuisoli]